MHIDGTISVWFHSDSRFQMDFHQVSVTEAIDLLHILQDALQGAKDLPPVEYSYVRMTTEDETEECHDKRRI